MLLGNLGEEKAVPKQAVLVLIQIGIESDCPGDPTLDDQLVVETWIQEGRRSSVTFGQRIKREGEDSVLVEGAVKVACIGTNMKPRRLPEELLPDEETR